jgi:hypothetical protein
VRCHAPQRMPKSFRKRPKNRGQHVQSITRAQWTCNRINRARLWLDEDEFQRLDRIEEGAHCRSTPTQNSYAMKTSIYSNCALILAIAGVSLWIIPVAPAAVILQSPGSNSVAFEAEANVTITAGTPTSFVITNDATPSGSTALFTSGPLGQGTDFPRGFASYSIKFSTPGMYKLFYRWRANPVYGQADLNTGNSFRMPNKFNATTVSSVDANTDYVVSSGNNAVAFPASGNYNLLSDNQLLEVTQAQVDAGEVLVFTIGTREAGMTFDRFVLTLESTLTDAQFNALPNSDTDVFIQGSGANFVAWEAESPKLRITPGTPTSFVITNDPTPSGSTALFTSGPLGQGTDYPRGFASYSIQFSTPGMYKFFYRWRANPVYGQADLNTGNSFRMPNKFNATTVSSVDANTDYVVSSGNNAVAFPASGNYNLLSDNQLLEVTQAQVDAGEVLVFTIGTREAGMTFDRFVLTLESTLTDAQFNALPNTGADPTPPQIVAVAGSATLTHVTLTFSEPLNEATVLPDRFGLSGGLGVLTATLDPASLRVVTLTTESQTEGNNYVVTVNNVTDLSGNAIAANSQITFTAWRVVPGWIRRDLYFELPGSTVGDLTGSPKYPDQPDAQDVIPGARFQNTPQRINYGARLSFSFVPNVTGEYEFFLYNDDEAQLYVGLDNTEDLLELVLTSPASSSNFSETVKGSIQFHQFVQGERYAMRVLWKQGTGDSLLAVGARRVGDTTPAEELQPLGGTLIETVLNPDTAVVNYSAQPQNASVTAGNRARFFAEASSPGGPVFYQWQVNGVNIPGATRQAYTTPLLSVADSGKTYRVIATGGGTNLVSAAATVTVLAGAALPVEPYIGVNFVGGNTGQNQPGGTLRSNDVFGVIGQENYNNISGNSVTMEPLVDAAGDPTTVTITYTVNGPYFTGTGESTADHVAFQGYLENANQPIDIMLGGVPRGVYDLYVYSVGFAFNATYEQAYVVRGQSVSPTNHVKAQTGIDFLGDPVLRRMASTDPDARDFGNYVVFENVSPSDFFNLSLTITPESTNVGVNVLPAVNALQLVRVLAALSIVPGPAAGQATVSWNGAAIGYRLESSPILGAGAQWQLVSGVADPLLGAGSTAVSTTGAARYYRLQRQP